jgi:membrane protease YdiL (CAAX protease family)
MAAILYLLLCPPRPQSQFRTSRKNFALPGIPPRFSFFLPTLWLSTTPSRGLKYPIAVHAFTLGFQWLLFYLAYRGILSSGLQLSEVLGKSRSIRKHFWTDCKDGLVIFFLNLAVVAFLIKLQPFPHTSTFHSKSALQYVFAMLVAVSAGFTEEVVFRGLFLNQLRILTRSVTAAIYLQAVLFSLAHGAAQSLSQMLSRLGAKPGRVM